MPCLLLCHHNRWVHTPAHQPRTGAGSKSSRCYECLEAVSSNMPSHMCRMARPLSVAGVMARSGASALRAASCCTPSMMLTTRQSQPLPAPVIQAALSVEERKVGPVAMLCLFTCCIIILSSRQLRDYVHTAPVLVGHLGTQSRNFLLQ